MAGTILITGVGRRRGIGAGLALGLAADGWDLVLNHWTPYDDRLGLVRGAHDVADVAEQCRALGVRVEVVSADLGDPEVPGRLVEAAAALAGSGAGPLRGAAGLNASSRSSTIVSAAYSSGARPSSARPCRHML